MQTANVQINVLSPTGTEPAVISAKDQSEILKEKYKKFRKNQKEKGAK